MAAALVAKRVYATNVMNDALLGIVECRYQHLKLVEKFHWEIQELFVVIWEFPLNG